MGDAGAGLVEALANGIRSERHWPCLLVWC
jgi:hypothetical protein